MRFNRFCFHLRFITTGRSKERRQCVNSKIVVDEGKVVTNENGNCRPREQIENGRVINVPTKDGMVAEYKCDPFFRLKGSFVLLFFLFFFFLFFFCGTISISFEHFIFKHLRHDVSKSPHKMFQFFIDNLY